MYTSGTIYHNTPIQYTTYRTITTTPDTPARKRAIFEGLPPPKDVPITLPPFTAREYIQSSMIDYPTPPRPQSTIRVTPFTAPVNEQSYKPDSPRRNLIRAHKPAPRNMVVRTLIENPNVETILPINARSLPAPSI
jgi:hypothetical protein